MKEKDFLTIEKELGITTIKIYIGNLKKELKITDELLDVQVMPFKFDITEMTKEHADWKIKECLPEKDEDFLQTSVECECRHWNACIDQILSNKDKK